MVNCPLDIKLNGARLEKHHDISAFIGEDNSRFALSAICYDPDKQELTATDGKIIITVPVGIDDGFPRPEGLKPLQGKTLVASGPFKHAIKRIRKHSKSVVEQEMLLSGRGNSAALVTSDLTDMVETDAGYSSNLPYPNYACQMPITDPVAKIRLGSDQLKALAKYAKAHGDGSVEFSIHTAEDRVGFTIHRDIIAAPTKGIVMQAS